MRNGRREDPGGIYTPVPGLPEKWQAPTLSRSPSKVEVPQVAERTRGFTQNFPPSVVVPFHRWANIAFTNTANFSGNIDQFTTSAAQSLVITSLVFRVFVSAGDGMTELGGASSPYFTALRIQFRFSADSLNSVGQYTTVNSTVGLSSATSFAGMAATGTNVGDLLGWRNNFGLVVRGGGRIVTSYTTTAIFGVTVPDRVSSEIGGFLAPHQFVEEYLAAQAK